MRMMKQFAATVAAIGAAGSAVLMLVATASPASAHVQTNAGPYAVEVGWNVEPTYAGIPNGVFLSVHDKDDKPVNDIGDKLRVVVSAAGKQSDPLPLKSEFDEDSGAGAGDFVASLIPTTPGAYTFKFTGTINGEAFNKSFTASDSTFDEVVDPRSVQFPEKTPTAAELSTKAARVSTRVDAAASKAKSADDSASTAKTLGILALIVGIVLGGAGLAVGLNGRRPSTK